MIDYSGVSPFAKNVYEMLCLVPKGRVTTYGDLARAIRSGSPRAIGQVLKTNPFAPEVPCHRVVSSDGTIGGFMGQTDGENIRKKCRILESEGVKIDGRRVRDFQRIRWIFTNQTPHT